METQLHYRASCSSLQLSVSQGEPIGIYRHEMYVHVATQQVQVVICVTILMSEYT